MTEEEKRIEMWADMAESPSLLLEMARIGYFGNRFEVYVNTDDPGSIPHFHVRDRATRGQEFHTCIRIDSNRYFHHTGKEDILNAKERKQLVEFLQRAPEDAEELGTNWRNLLVQWNANNSDSKVSKTLEMPDYMNIREG